MTPETNHDVEISIYHDYLEDQGIIVDRNHEEQDQWWVHESKYYSGVGGVGGGGVGVVGVGVVGGRVGFVVGGRVVGGCAGGFIGVGEPGAGMRVGG